MLGTEWLVGAATVPALELAKTFARLDSIAIGALVDEEDDFGPESEVDLERQTRSLPAALVRVDAPISGKRVKAPRERSVRSTARP